MQKENIFIIAEVGINHNGDLDIAKRLILEAKKSGCNAVKFQKRTVTDVYTPEELDKPRESPWGTTNREQKLGLEFEKEEYDEINSYCQKIDIEWFASAWDLNSQKFLSQYNSNYNKVASPMLRVTPLLEMIANEGKYTFISTGMSTVQEIEAAVAIFENSNCPYELMHCNSSYPSDNSEANLNTISTLRNKSCL